MNYWHIKQAVRAINEGGVIAYPTEAVYGLGCSPWSYPAICQLLTLKQRDIGKGLILVAASVEDLEPLIELSDLAHKEAVLASWPGPVTWLLPTRRDVPVWLTGQYNNLAVRVSAHPLVRALTKLSGPLVSTSANPSGLSPARSSLKVREYFGDAPDYILPGNIGRFSRPTTIIDGQTGQTIR